MKIRLIAFILLGCLLPGGSLAAQIKLRHITSIYTDADGTPLREPVGVSITNDQLLIADSGGKRLLRFSIRGDIISPEANVPLPDMRPILTQQAPNGDLYILDGRSRNVMIFNAQGVPQGAFAPKGMPDSRRIETRSFRLTPDGSLLLLDIFSRRVLFFDKQANFLQQLPLPETHAAFADITIDRQGSIYLLDSINAQVFKARAGAGDFLPLTTHLKENMNFPVSLTVDPQGNLILVDKNGSGLVLIDPEGRFAGRKLGMGWSESQLYYPSGIALNSKGLLCVADTSNHRVQLFQWGE